MNKLAIDARLQSVYTSRSFIIRLTSDARIKKLKKKCQIKSRSIDEPKFRKVLQNTGTIIYSCGCNPNYFEKKNEKKK